MKKLSKAERLFYGLSAIGSGVGFMTQILVSGFWSTAFSQDVTFYSVNLAFYFLSLGVGARWSDRLSRPSVGTLVLIVIALCGWCGFSISFLRWVIFRFNEATWLAVACVCVAGVLAGAVLPLTLSLSKKQGGIQLGTLFLVDYAAAIVFTLLFTFVLLIPLGYTGTSLAVSLATLVLVLFLSPRELLGDRAIRISLAAAFLLPWPISKGARLLSEMSASGAKVLLARQSHYQKIVLTESVAGPSALHPGVLQYSLYLDGFAQFSSASEELYHHCLATLPNTAASFSGHQVKKALILGGGDGFAARNLVAVPSIEKIQLVELDAVMIELASSDSRFLKYNHGSLKDPRVTVTVADAFRWIAHNREKFDLIIIDFPTPKNLALARLFSAEFYDRVFSSLTAHGFVSIQAGPYFSPRDRDEVSTITATIARTVEATGNRAWIYYTPRDADAFVLATPSRDFSMDVFAKTVGIEMGGPLSGTCAYNPDISRPAVAINTLNTLPIATYAMQWYREVGGTGFFYYSDAYGVFLPD